MNRFDIGRCYLKKNLMLVVRHNFLSRFGSLFKEKQIPVGLSSGLPS